MKRAELVNALMDEMLSEIREEIKLCTVAWRKKPAPELVEIAQIAYEVLQKRENKNNEYTTTRG